MMKFLGIMVICLVLAFLGLGIWPFVIVGVVWLLKKLFGK